MDLRPYHLSAPQIETGSLVLNYQPFIISDDIQTGVAYSWLYSDDQRISPPLVFRRGQKEWDKAIEANARLRTIYDGFIKAIADRYPDRTLLDVACNNGYFPVQAELMGMKASTGMDAGPQYKKSIEFLNNICGTHAKFILGVYDTHKHRAPIDHQYDVVVASAIMCHLPDPTQFLAFLGHMAREAVFFWGQVIDSESAIIAFNPPHEALDLQHGDTPFPHCFNDNTRMSRGLMELSFKLMGFGNVTYLPTNLLADAEKVGLEAEITRGSRHLAVLAMRH